MATSRYLYFDEGAEFDDLDFDANKIAAAAGGRPRSRSRGVWRRVRSKSRARSKSRSRSKSARREAGAGDAFMRQLRAMGYSRAAYLSAARKAARRAGYEPARLHFALNNNHKLVYESPEGNKYFGKAGYGDYLIWSFKERHGDARSGYARMKRNVFRTSHGAITKMYGLNKFSPNELSIRILW
jgi:hypothetical protein